MNGETQEDIIIRVLDKAGLPIGNEHHQYSTSERVEALVKIKDYFVRQTDQARLELAEAKAAIAKAEGKQ